MNKKLAIGATAALVCGAGVRHYTLNSIEDEVYLQSDPHYHSELVEYQARTNSRIGRLKHHLGVVPLRSSRERYVVEDTIRRLEFKLLCARTDRTMRQKPELPPVTGRALLQQQEFLQARAKRRAAFLAERRAAWAARMRGSTNNAEP
jgi:hypothetical protein